MRPLGRLLTMEGRLALFSEGANKMSKFIMIGLVTVATLVGAAANAREVCKTVSLPTMNCGPDGKCFVTYTTAQVCKQVPDTPKPTTKLGTGATVQGTFNA